MNLAVFTRPIYKNLDLEVGTYKNVKFNFENDNEKDYITVIYTLETGREVRINYFASGGRSLNRLASEIVQNFEYLEEKTVPEILAEAVNKTFTLYVTDYVDAETGRKYTNYNLVQREARPTINKLALLNELDKDPIPM